MGRKCEFYWCSNQQGYGISFYQFPAENEMCHAWVEKCCSSEATQLFAAAGSQAFKNKRICSVHFALNAFKEPSRKEKGLVPNAVPFECSYNQREGNERHHDELYHDGMSCDFLEDDSIEFIEGDLDYIEWQRCTESRVTVEPCNFLQTDDKNKNLFSPVPPKKPDVPTDYGFIGRQSSHMRISKSHTPNDDSPIICVPSDPSLFVNDQWSKTSTSEDSCIEIPESIRLDRFVLSRDTRTPSSPSYTLYKDERLVVEHHSSSQTTPMSMPTFCDVSAYSKSGHHSCHLENPANSSPDDITFTSLQNTSAVSNVEWYKTQAKMQSSVIQSMTRKKIRSHIPEQKITTS